MRVGFIARRGTLPRRRVVDLRRKEVKTMQLPINLAAGYKVLGVFAGLKIGRAPSESNLAGSRSRGSLRKTPPHARIQGGVDDPYLIQGLVANGILRISLSPSTSPFLQG